MFIRHFLARCYVAGCDVAAASSGASVAAAAACQHHTSPENTGI